MRQFYLSIVIVLLLLICNSGLAVDGFELVGEYRWSEEEPPTGRCVPYLGEYQGEYVLKCRKYSEGYVDLGQGDRGELRFSGAVTILAVCQIAKQWPMRAALVSKWSYLEGGASYDFGFTAERKLYFRVSPDGGAEKGWVEVVGAESQAFEDPLAVAAVYEPGQFMRLYVNGRLAGERMDMVPQAIHDSVTAVRLGGRFEGLLAGVWFYDGALSESEIESWSAKSGRVLPEGTVFSQWKDIKCKSEVGPADFLGTTAGMKLVKKIDITPYAGSYVSPGDLNNDGRLDYLLYKNGSAYTVPGRLIAINDEGKLLWQVGDVTLEKHLDAGKAEVGEPGTTPALRGVAVVYDIDRDGCSEVICELWEDNQPWLCVLDGATGEVERKIVSPINMAIRQPGANGNRQPGRSHPVLRIAHLRGKDGEPAIILKYGVSNGIDCYAFALDKNLEIIWQVVGTPHSMGHIPTVADVDNDGYDEVVLGHMLVDDDGRVLWDKGEGFTWHADCTAVASLRGGVEKQILISVCGVGPLYCLDVKGNILWSRPRDQVEHGQALWVGNFIDDVAGPEVIACVRGHVGAFITFRGADGETLAEFSHRRQEGSYPDFPSVVNWQSTDKQCLWLPQDRVLVDGRGNIIAELGELDEEVADKLNVGTSWRPVGAQAFALDVCSDERDEIILYEPYAGTVLCIFMNPDSQMTAKKYVPQPAAYNIRSYF